MPRNGDVSSRTHSQTNSCAHTSPCTVDLEAGKNLHQRACVEVAPLAAQLAQAQGLEPRVGVQLLDAGEGEGEGEGVAGGIATEGGQGVLVSLFACKPSRAPNPRAPSNSDPCLADQILPHRLTQLMYPQLSL